MKRLQLKSIHIINFMGCKEQKIDFTNSTNISGANGSGKSTIYEAFIWLITGKNSRNQSDFEIKNTKDLSLNRQDHSVTCEFKITDEHKQESIVTLSKVYKETWTKKRGSEEAEYSGNSTEYFYNNVPMKMSEFKSKIDSLIPEHIFKLITNVKWFNEMDWRERRKILSDIAGAISDNDIAKSRPQFVELFNKLGEKTFEEYKREIAASKSKLKDELKAIPIRISEANQSKIENINYNELEEQLRTISLEKQELTNDKEEKVKANKKVLDDILAKQNEKNQLQQKLNQLTNDNKNKFSLNKTGISGEMALCQSRIKKIESDIQIHKNDITNLNNSIKSLTEIVDLTREQWNTLNAEVLPPYDEAKCICPSCQQRLPEDKIQTFKETYKENYNKDKAKKLEDLRTKGKSNNSIIEKNKTEINNILQIISTLEHELESQKTILSGLNIDYEIESKKTYEPSQEEIDLDKQINEFVIPESPKINNEEINLKIQELDTEISEINKQLGTKDINYNLDQRIKTLEKDEKQFAQSLSNLEKEEFLMNEFNKIKVDYIESKVNQMFQYVTFKMFEQQINGSDIECCIAMYDGVPYNVVNTAGRINMGLDIINVLSNYYQYQAPVFIDNRESVGILIKTDLQIINMEHIKDAPFTVTNN